MQLLADQGVPQPQRPVEHLRPSGEAEGDGGHVGSLDGVQAGHCAQLVALALAHREVCKVFGDVEARHDSTSAGVYNEVDHVWLDLHSYIQCIVIVTHELDRLELPSLCNHVAGICCTATALEMISYCCACCLHTRV